MRRPYEWATTSSALHDPPLYAHSGMITYHAARRQHMRSRRRLETLVGQCSHTSVTLVVDQQSNTDQQMSFRNR